LLAGASAGGYYGLGMTKEGSHGTVYRRRLCNRCDRLRSEPLSFLESYPTSAKSFAESVAVGSARNSSAVVCPTMQICAPVAVAESLLVKPESFNPSQADRTVGESVLRSPASWGCGVSATNGFEGMSRRTHITTPSVLNLPGSFWSAFLQRRKT
jgi:hypothetical protein